MNDLSLTEARCETTTTVRATALELARKRAAWRKTRELQASNSPAAYLAIALGGEATVHKLAGTHISKARAAEIARKQFKLPWDLEKTLRFLALAGAYAPYWPGTNIARFARVAHFAIAQGGLTPQDYLLTLACVNKLWNLGLGRELEFVIQLETVEPLWQAPGREALVETLRDPEDREPEEALPTDGLTPGVIDPSVLTYGAGSPLPAGMSLRYFDVPEYFEDPADDSD